MALSHHSTLSSFAVANLPRFSPPSRSFLRPKRFEVRSSKRAKNGEGRGSISPLVGILGTSHKDRAQSESESQVRVSVVLRRMWDLLGGDRWIAFVAFGALIGAAVSEISIPGTLTAAIFSAQRGEAVAFYRSSRLLVVLCVISGICSGVRSGFFAFANVIMVRRLREAVYSAIVLQDISFFDREAVGILTSRLGADCEKMSNIIGNDINRILRNAFQGTGALANLLILSWPLALSAVVLSSMLSAIFLIVGRYQRKAAKSTQDFTAGANEVAHEAFSLIRTIRIYGAEENEQERFKHWLEKIAFVATGESKLYGIWNLSFTTLYRSTQVFAVIIGGTSILRGHLSMEQLAKYVLYCEWFIYATWRLMDSALSLLQSVGASEQVFGFMDLVPSSHFLSKGKKMPRISGHIQFVNVSFHYPLRPNVSVLERVYISIQANEFIAIVGPSGSGKSTLIKLLLRLYEPTSGNIYVDGFPLKELDMRWLIDKFGFVEQEPHLFHMDIGSNIKYGCSRDIKPEDVESAAKQAYAHEFISSLPRGYKTPVDDKLLSGGQKQRIAIARAILRDPSILILDEPTSALDTESELYVTEILHGFRNDKKSNRTVVVIAHRFSTIRAADRIIVMDRGQVVEMGNHTELTIKNGLYAKLVKAHTHGFP